MSDQTPASDEPEEDEEGRVRPRHQSAAERRSSETVMLDSGNLGDMVSEAKSDAAPPASGGGVLPVEDEEVEEEQERQNIILIVGVAVIIVLAGIVGYLIYIVPD
jgi:hypothetical protein